MYKYSLYLLAGLAAYTEASCMHGTSRLRRRETAEGKVEISDFGYTNLQGPLNWANLKAENSACATSKVQSPINIDDTIGAAAEVPVIDIANVESAEVENLGTTVETIVNGTTTIGGVDFELAQFHLHTPSEHRINEEYFPLEMHMVHEAADGTIAVLAVLFQLSEDGSTTDLLTSVTANLAEIVEPGTITTTAALDFLPLVNHLTTTTLRSYTGSLTTPPCAEGLQFLVTEQPLPINVATFNQIKSVIKFNSRYTQNKLGESNLLAADVGGSKAVEASCVVGGSAEAVLSVAPAAPASTPNFVVSAVPASSPVAVVEVLASSTSTVTVTTTIHSLPAGYTL